MDKHKPVDLQRFRNVIEPVAKRYFPESVSYTFSEFDINMVRMDLKIEFKNLPVITKTHLLGVNLMKSHEEELHATIGFLAELVQKEVRDLIMYNLGWPPHWINPK